ALGQRRKATRPKGVLQRAVCVQHLCCSRRPQSRNPRQLVRWVATQRDEIRNLVGIDSVAQANLGWTDPGDLARANWIKNRRVGGGELECVAVAARDQDGAAPPLFGRDRGGKEVVGLVPSHLGIRKAACGDEFRQHVKLLEQFVIEFAAALIGRELLVTIGRRVHIIPTDEHGARLLRPVELEQKVRKAKDGTRRPASASQYGFG